MLGKLGLGSLLRGFLGGLLGSLFGGFLRGFLGGLARGFLGGTAASGLFCCAPGCLFGGLAGRIASADSYVHGRPPHETLRAVK
ncbi:hypothetical protein D3C87_1797250 [compost metagenome]